MLKYTSIEFCTHVVVSIYRTNTNNQLHLHCHLILHNVVRLTRQKAVLSTVSEFCKGMGACV